VYAASHPSYDNVEKSDQRMTAKMDRERCAVWKVRWWLRVFAIDNRRVKTGISSEIVEQSTLLDLEPASLMNVKDTIYRYSGIHQILLPADTLTEARRVPVIVSAG